MCEPDVVDACRFLLPGPPSPPPPPPPPPGGPIPLIGCSYI